ncbi:MAG TPA: chorismate lyase [Burkholderiales bacterium]|nr:chorismate lyase [Burkholderiales bacterium]
MTPIPSDTFWQPAPAAAGRYRPWLTDRGSLTARIAARCPGVRVEVVFQGLRRPDRDERFVFAHDGRARVLVREIFLRCGDVPVVFAHTVLDPADLCGPWRSVARLGNRPLGAALFADPRIERHALRQRKIGWHHELHRRLRATIPDAPPALWARRSLFRLHNSPILVTEVFLPEILRL